MDRLVAKAIFQMCAKAALLTAIVGAIIGVIGYVNKWDGQYAYSNAFFLAGCLLIIAGASSRYNAGQGWNVFQQFHAESFRGMSRSEQAKFIIDTSSSMSTVILGVLSGIFLIILSALAAYLF